MQTQEDSQLERETRVEREQVEQVFGLTGGELADETWEPFAPEADGESFTRTCFHYWYEGTPEGSGYGRHQAHSYRTVVSDCLFGEEPPALYEQGARWQRVACLLSSGEAECPWQDCEPCSGREARPCELCQAGPEEEHGQVYLGEGWCETLYLQVETCPDCGADITQHRDYGDRCLACDPYAFQVAAYGTRKKVLYQGSDPATAEAAYSGAVSNPKLIKADLYLELDEETIRQTLRR